MPRIARTAEELGAQHERQLEREGRRRSSGAFYTPAAVVDALLARSLDPVLAERARQGVDAVRAVRVVDPACGSGNILVAAARRIEAALVAMGEPVERARASAYADCVRGVDVDPRAVEICQSALVGEGRVPARVARRRVIAADALLLPRAASPGASWLRLLEDTAEGVVDIVVGNPPFRGQLRRATAFDRDYRAGLSERFPGMLGPYTDPAALFLLVGAALVRPDGGVIALIQPVSVLAARDAAAIRDHLAGECAITEAWFPDDRAFDADVDVCAMTMVRGPGRATTTVTRGTPAREVASVRAPRPGRGWGSLLAAAREVPSVAIAASGTVGDVATVSADFRDQFYGVAAHVIDAEHRDDAEAPRLVTVGLIDPARLLWGERATRVGGTAYSHPRVPLAALGPAMRAWAESRLVPKVLVATQSRTVEVIVDDAGGLLPSVPVISVAARGEQAWRIAACLGSPPIAAWALQEYAGAGLALDAIKLSARQVARVPLPCRGAPWDEGTGLFRRAQSAHASIDRHRLLVAMGRAMCLAYAVDPDAGLLAWWSRRLRVS